MKSAIGMALYRVIQTMRSMFNTLPPLTRHGQLRVKTGKSMYDDI